MHLDDEAIGAERGCTAAEGGNEVGAATALAGVDDDGKMGFFFGDGDGGEIESVAGVGFEGANAALAEQDVGIAVGEQIFGGEEPFFDFFAHAAFEHHGFAGVRAFDEKAEVLSVAGADLEDVGGFRDMLNVALAQDFGDDLESGAVAGFAEEAKAFDAEALEFVGRGAWFVGAAAEDGGSGGFDGVGGGEELGGVFHGAGTGHDTELRATDRDAAGVYNGIGRVGFAAGELVALLDAEHAFDLREGGEGLQVLMGSFVADGGDDGLLDPRDWGGFITECFDLRDDLIDLLGRGTGAKNDDHGKRKNERIEVRRDARAGGGKL